MFWVLKRDGSFEHPKQLFKQMDKMVLLSTHIEDIQIFRMNMPFISSSEEKNAYFMSGEATNETCIFLFTR